MRQQSRRLACVIFAAALILPHPVLAQTAAAVVRGIVVDARDGTPLRRVAVRLQTTVTVTGDDGRFEIANAPAGRQELNVSVVDFILVKRTIEVPTEGVLELTIPIAAGTGTYSESVTVRPSAESAAPPPTGVNMQTLTSRELQQLRGTLTNDPFRAVQSLPGVAAADDLRSEFTVRGNAIDHMNFTFEGVPAPFLVHTVQGIHDSGSIAMVNGDVLDDIVLLAGSYPQKFGGRTGAELDFQMREGSRDGTRTHVSVSLTDAAGVVEGPLGRGRRGSWLFSARRSYLDRLIRRLDEKYDVAFGFTDVQAKFVYDAATRHQIQVALAGGRSRLDRIPDTLGTGEVKDGRNGTIIGILTWRYASSAHFLLSQKGAAAVNRFRNFNKDGLELARGAADELLYRADWSFALSSKLTLDGGGHLSRSAGNHLRDYGAHAVAGSVYAQSHSSLGKMTVTTGVRVDRWGIVRETKASPWLQAARPLGNRLLLRMGGGLFRQPPGFQSVAGIRGTSGLRSEHAAQFDLSIEGRLTRSTTWQISAYDREDRDLIRLPFSEFRLVGARLVAPSGASRYLNSLDGHSRGTEVFVRRTSPNGLSGWLAYSFAHTRYHDTQTGEQFWGDWDERHTLNAYSAYRFSDRVSASTRFRYGSNFPTVGYWESRGNQYFVSATRNALRVKPYSRLDLRVNRTFTWQEKRLTLFVEIINAYGRRNVRPASPGINTRTFEVFGLFDQMFPRIPSAGFLLEF